MTTRTRFFSLYDFQPASTSLSICLPGVSAMSHLGLY